MTPAKFRALVWRYYKEHGRHDLPWRATHDLYRILVSEVMLQQTQVDRVIPLYKNFIRKFPTASKLAIAPLAEVLKAWQGLGYNRRAKMLHFAAKELTTKKFSLVEELEELPGVGSYTARAVTAFTFNSDVIVVETNIRTAVIHHFFSDRNGQHQVLTKISDKEIEKILIRVLPKGRAREWYSALMDYGAHLKRSGISHNARSTTHAKQSKFSGSLRQARGAILRELTKGRANISRLTDLLGDERRAQLEEALAALLAEHLIVRNRYGYALPD